MSFASVAYFLISEFRSVLAYPKFRLTKDEIDHLKFFLMLLGKQQVFFVCKEPS